MRSRLPTCVIRNGVGDTVISTEYPLDSAVSDGSLVRLLVLDDQPQTVEHIENALWVWPHRITRTNCLREAVSMCQHQTPMAILVSLTAEANSHGRLIADLRHALSRIPIVAIGTPETVRDPGTILEQGANAILSRENLQLPSLHELLMRLPVSVCDTQSSQLSDQVVMPFPWCNSEILGSLICDIRGKVVCANKHLADLLGYQKPDDLNGLCVTRDILCSAEDWASWKSVAGNTKKILRQSATIKSKNQQPLFMSIETFALAQSPNKVQAVFVDLSNLMHEFR